MASRGKGDDTEPQEDDELTEQFDMDKMNSTTNGLAPNGRPNRLSTAELRNRFKQARTTLLSDRHYQLHACLLLLILFLGLMLIYVSAKLLSVSFRDQDNICHSSSCLQASARVLSNANLSLDACDNFFDYACGAWAQANELTDNQAYYSVSGQVNDQIYDDIRRFLDQVLPTSSSNDPHYKVKRFYQSCMALEDIDVLSLNYFKHDIQNVGGWNIMGTWNGLEWSQAATIERLQVLYGVEAFFRIEVGADDLDPQLPFIIKIFPSGLGLPKSYYFDPQYKQVVEAYKQYMSETVKIFGGTKLDSSQYAENTFNYEKRIAEISHDKSEYQTPSNMFKRRYSIRELKLIAPSIKWTEILQNYFQKARLNDNTRVLLAFEPYFRNISNIISTTDSRGINDYLIWRMVSAYAPYLSKDFRIIYKNFHQVLYGMPISNFLNDENRWKFCIETTSKYMGYALSSVYINNRIAQISNATVSAKTEIINAIRETILKNSELFVWNSNDNAHKLINMKLKQMEILVGQPSFVMKSNLLDYYNEFITQAKFLQNIIESIDHRHKKMEMLLNEKKTDFAWTVLPHEVQVSYDYAANKLYVPFAMLQLPFFSPLEPPVMQFGALGFQVASQMLRAFDLTGLYYGLPDGRLSANWTIDHSGPLNSALSCLDEDISAYHPKANETLSQTLVDIGALKVAWLAYKEFAAKRAQETALPSLSLTGDQLFFLSFGQSMCSNVRPATLDYRWETSNQLPDSLRVNSVLQQSKFFTDAFKCSQTLRRRQCRLWK